MLVILFKEKKTMILWHYLLWKTSAFGSVVARSILHLYIFHLCLFYCCTTICVGLSQFHQLKELQVHITVSGYYCIEVELFTLFQKHIQRLNLLLLKADLSSAKPLQTRAILFLYDKMWPIHCYLVCGIRMWVHYPVPCINHNKQSQTSWQHNYTW